MAPDRSFDLKKKRERERERERGREREREGEKDFGAGGREHQICWRIAYARWWVMGRRNMYFWTLGLLTCHPLWPHAGGILNSNLDGQGGQEKPRLSKTCLFKILNWDIVRHRVEEMPKNEARISTSKIRRKFMTNPFRPTSVWIKANLLDVWLYFIYLLLCTCAPNSPSKVFCHRQPINFKFNSRRNLTLCVCVCVCVCACVCEYVSVCVSRVCVVPNNKSMFWVSECWTWRFS